MIDEDKLNALELFGENEYLHNEVERLKEENKKYNKWIESLNKDNHRLNNIIEEVRNMLYKRELDNYDTYTANVVLDIQSDFEEILRGEY